MVVLRSGTSYVNAEPQATSTTYGNHSSAEVSSSDGAEEDPESVPPAGQNAGAQQTQPVISLPTSPTTTTPQLPAPLRRTYICYCGKPAIQWLCRKGRPENLDKFYYRCPDEKCSYWKWIESSEDARERRRRDANNVKGVRCYCGRLAVRLVSKNGMPHNYGRVFYKCHARRCDFFMWEDGSLPFSDESQALFNDYMDAYLGYT